MSFFSLAFKATIHHDRAFIATFSTFKATFIEFRAVNLVWAFRASSLVFSVISFFFSSASRATSLVQHSKSSFSSVQRSKLPSLFSSAFKAASPVWHSKSLFLSDSAFRATISFQPSIQSHHFLTVQHLDSPYLQFGFQSHGFSLAL